MVQKTMWKTTIGLYLLLLCGPSIAASCESVIKYHLNADLHASELFPNSRNTFVVVLCKHGTSPIYDKFFAHLHDSAQHQYNTPTGGLSRLHQVLDPNGKTRTTGVIVSSTKNANEYTLQTRTRMATGEAIDIATTMQLKQKESHVFVSRGITVGVARL